MNRSTDKKGMKTLLFALGMIALSGCSHAYVANWDKDEVTACCPSNKVFCTESTLSGLAKDHCGGEVSLLGGGTKEGSEVSVNRNWFSGQVYGVKAIQDKCEVFKCEAREPASK